ncbi:hypothetical protein [Micromonospora sp. NPDC047730]|uniref:hypothetical protein n=1 Tax=Micromonospora sp. NPDC047730 TaxID=3364253 RepID=UPI00371EBC37
MTRWRYIAQRAVTGEFVDWDVPIARDELSWSLSGPGSLRGTIAPDVGRLRGPDGRPLLDEWGTLLYAEADGEIRWGGVVVQSGFSGSAWRVEATGFTAYPHGVPYLDLYSKVGVDPLDAVREVWRHVQAQPDGDLGMLVDPTTTPVRLGKPVTPAYQEVQIGGVWVRKDSVPASSIEPSASAKLKASIDANDTSLTLAALGVYAQLTPPYLVTVGSETIRVGGRTGSTLTGLTRGHGTSKATSHRAGTVVRHTGTPTRTVAARPAEPYQLAWWDAPDCGGELDALARETPFDYAEEHYWDGDKIAHRLRIGYPRLGRRRTDLAFVQGDNVTSVVAPERDGEGFANEVVGHGAGEGRTVLQRRIPERDGRLRRPFVYADKSVTTSARMDALARAELATRRHTLEIDSVEVVDHPNAPIGSWALGDDIPIRAVIPWLGEVEVWERVVGWAMRGEDRAVLNLRRSDAFTYARSPE